MNIVRRKLIFIHNWGISSLNMFLIPEIEIFIKDFENQFSDILDKSKFYDNPENINSRTSNFSTTKEAKLPFSDWDIHWGVKQNFHVDDIKNIDYFIRNYSKLEEVGLILCKIPNLHHSFRVETADSLHYMGLIKDIPEKCFIDITFDYVNKVEQSILQSKFQNIINNEFICWILATSYRKKINHDVYGAPDTSYSYWFDFMHDFLLKYYDDNEERDEIFKDYLLKNNFQKLVLVLEL